MPRPTLGWGLLPALFATCLMAGDLAEEKKPAPDLAKDEAYFKALSLLEELDKDSKGAIDIFNESTGHNPDLIFQFLSTGCLINIRETSKSLYRSKVRDCLAARLLKQCRFLDLDSTASTLLISAPILRAALCLRRRLAMPVMTPLPQELALIEKNLALDDKFRLAAAYLQSLRGDGDSTSGIVQSLADSGNARAKMIANDLAYLRGIEGHRPADKDDAFESSSIPDFDATCEQNCLAGHIFSYGILDKQYPNAACRSAKLKALSMAYSLKTNFYARKLLLRAIFAGWYGFSSWSLNERWAEFNKIANSKDSELALSARDLLVEAFLWGKFGQEYRSAEERYKDVKALADNGHVNAQKSLAETLFKGRLLKIPVPQRFLVLKAEAEAGNPYGKKYLAKALYGGSLGQGMRLGDERFVELEKLAAEGSAQAEGHVADAIRCGTFGQDEIPWEQRRQKLENMADKGNEGAQKILADLIYHQDLEYPLRDQAQVLKARAALGDRHAEKRYVDALCRGSFGPAARSKARLEELRSVAMAGESAVNLYAREIVMFIEPDLARPISIDTLRQVWEFARLKATAASNDAQAAKDAQRQVDMAILFAENYQRHRPQKERWCELRNRAAAGNAETQDTVLQAISKGDFEGLPAESDVDIALAYALYNEMMIALASCLPNAKP